MHSVYPGFNTSHVVVYLISHGHKDHSLSVFQYISCCSLSMNHVLMKIGMFSFNTSHVVVYPYLALRKAYSFVCFNTSHVVVYQNSGQAMILINACFNTSHVVVYHF